MTTLREPNFFINLDIDIFTIHHRNNNNFAGYPTKYESGLYFKRRRISKHLKCVQEVLSNFISGLAL